MNIGVKAFVIYEGRMLLILRDDVPTIPYPNTWNLPGGGVEKGEDFDTALKRELTEEIGMIPKTILRMGIESFDDKRTVVRYLVRLEEEEVEKLKFGDEGQEMRFFAFDDLLRLPFSPYLGNFISKNRIYLKRIIEHNEKLVPEKLGLVP